MAIISKSCLECGKRIANLDAAALEHDPEDSGYIEPVCYQCSPDHLEACDACRNYHEWQRTQLP